MSSSAPTSASAARRGMAVLLDQVVSSGSNFLLLLLVARSSSIDEFGAFVVIYAVLTFGVSLGRSSLGVPLTTDLPSLDHQAQHEFVGRSLTVALLYGSVVGFAGLMVVLAYGFGGASSVMLGSAAVAAPIVLAQDTGRYVTLARGRPQVALASDGVWLLVIVAAFLWSLVGDPVQLPVAVGAWIVGACGALSVLAGSLAFPRIRGTAMWFGRDRRRWHLLSDASFGAAAPFIVVTMTAAVLSASAVAAMRGASTLMTPLNVLISAAGTGLVPELVRRPDRSRATLAATVGTGIAAVAALWAGVLVVLPDQWGLAVLGPTWDSASDVLPVTALEMVALAIWTGSIALMLSRGQAREVVQIRAIYALVVVTTSTVAAFALGTPIAVQATVTSSALAVAVLSWVSARRRPPAPARPGGS